MDKLLFNDKESLLSVNAILHDTEFAKGDIAFDMGSGIFKISATEYEYKNTLLIQVKTDKIKARYTLILFNVTGYVMNDKDKKGYETIGVDSFNSIDMLNAKTLFINTAFHEIKIEIDKIDGFVEKE